MSEDQKPMTEEEKKAATVKRMCAEVLAMCGGKLTPPKKQRKTKKQ